MKKLFAISCAALLASILAVSMTVSVAFADDTGDAGGKTDWSVKLPEEETITQEVPTEGLIDYAVTLYTDPDNPGVSYYKYAFADNNGITIYSCYDTESGQIIDMGETENDGREYRGGTIETIELPGIVQTEYTEDGDLYCRNAFGLYVIYGGTATPVPAGAETFEFSDYDEYFGFVSEDDSFLYRITDGNLEVLDLGTLEADSYPAERCSETFRGLKKIGGTVYVLGDTLYTAEGGKIHPISFSYEDYNTELTIYTLNTFSLLEETADGIYYADIEGDALLIPVDLYESGETFKIPSRIRRFSDVQKDAGTAYAQVLLFSDDTVLIYYGRQTYLTYGKNTDVSSYPLSSPTHDAYYALDDTGLYSMPYPSASTRMSTVSKGGKVTVTEVAENSDISLFGTFYKAEYTDGDGETSTGYVLAAMFSEYDFDDDDPETVSVQIVEASYDDNVTLCVIIIVLAAVLLVAAIYLTLVLTSNKRKK